jgi:hypothetical protein
MQLKPQLTMGSTGKSGVFARAVIPLRCWSMIRRGSTPAAGKLFPSAVMATLMFIGAGGSSRAMPQAKPAGKELTGK